MQPKIVIAIAVSLTILAVSIRYAPLRESTHRDVAHYAVSVRKLSSCEKERSLLDELKAKAAYWLITWNVSGYKSYSESGRSLLLFTTGKIKCAPDKSRFLVESARANRAIDLALRRGEDINSVNGIGQNALHMAALAGNHLVAARLLDHGASLEAKNSEGETALDIVRSMAEADIGYDAAQIEPLLLTRE